MAGGAAVPLGPSAVAAAHGAAPGGGHKQGEDLGKQPCSAAQPAAAPGSPGAAAAAAAAEPSGPALRWIWQLVKPDVALLAATLTVIVLSAASSLCLPLAIGRTFDAVGAASGGVQVPGFRAAVTALFVCLGAAAACNAINSALAGLISQRAAHRLRTRLFSNLLARDQAFFDASRRGDLVSRITLDVEVMQASVASLLGGGAGGGQRGVRGLMETAGGAALVMLQAPLVGALLLVATPVMVALARRAVAASGEVALAGQRATSDALQLAAERVAQVQTVKQFAQEAREEAQFGERLQRVVGLAARGGVLQGAAEVAGRMVINVQTLAVLLLGGLLLLQGRLTIGELLSTNVLIMFVTVGLTSLAASVGDLGKAVGAARRMAEILPAEQLQAAAAAEGQAEPTAAGDGPGPEAERRSSHAAASSSSMGSAAAHASSSSITSGGGRAAPALSFRDVTFVYPGAEGRGPALQQLDLEVPSGSTVALVGPSGSGKSSIAALLLRLYEPTSGRILVDGRPLGEMDPAAWRRRVAAVMQDPGLMSGSIASNIRLGRPDATQQEVEAAAVAAGVAAFAGQLPGGLDAAVGERGAALSGGQRQRVAIARALVTDPHVLVFDEATSALDLESEAAVTAALAAARRGRTTLVIAHRLSTVRDADAIAIVDQGRVVEQGTHDELMALPGSRYAALVAASTSSDDEQQGSATGSRDGSHHASVPPAGALGLGLGGVTLVGEEGLQAGGALEERAGDRQAALAAR